MPENEHPLPSALLEEEIERMKRRLRVIPAEEEDSPLATSIRMYLADLETAQSYILIR